MSIDHYSTATEMLGALGRKEISSMELTEMHIARIETHDEKLNAIPIKTFDRARASAKAADKLISKNESSVLLGLPMTLKESSQVAGLPQTAGLEPFKGYAPSVDGTIAKRLFEQNPCLLGKTNIPTALGDWQADSPVYGRTNNPWDPERTPGGSTGGGGVALAAGMTPLELGSDIGGSIRVPAAFCGLYGHRPSETAIPRSGGFPMADLPNDLFLMAVQGPLARSVADLELMFDVIAGPDVGEDAGWQLALPEPRHRQLRDFRVGVVSSFWDIKASSQMSGRLNELVTFLQDEGTRVEETPLPFDVIEYYKDYVRLLMVLTSFGTPKAEREKTAKLLRARSDPLLEVQAEGLEMDAGDYLMLGTRRAYMQMMWREYFSQWDVLIAPMTLDSAFPHQNSPQEDRTLMVDNVEVSYFQNIAFPMLSIFTGQPSTAFPAGLDTQGLPLGLQAIGPYLEDRTTLEFVRLLESGWRKFEVPPGY